MFGGLASWFLGFLVSWFLGNVVLCKRAHSVALQLVCHVHHGTSHWLWDCRSVQKAQPSGSSPSKQVSVSRSWSHQRLFWGWHWNSDQERSQWFSSSSSSLNFCRTENGEAFDLCGNILDLQWQFSILAWPSSHMPAIVEGALLNVCTCIRKCCTLTSSALA